MSIEPDRSADGRLVATPRDGQAVDVGALRGVPRGAGRVLSRAAANDVGATIYCAGADTDTVEPAEADSDSHTDPTDADAVPPIELGIRVGWRHSERVGAVRRVAVGEPGRRALDRLVISCGFRCLVRLVADRRLVDCRLLDVGRPGAGLLVRDDGRDDAVSVSTAGLGVFPWRSMGVGE